MQPTQSFSCRTACRIALLTLLAAPAAPLFAGAPVYDQIHTYGAGSLAQASLPAGPAQPARAAAAGITSLQFLPSGMLLATTRTADTPARVMLNELRPDGSLRQIGTVGADLGLPSPGMVDMAIDNRGRLFMVLAESIFNTSVWLLGIDPATAAVLSANTTGFSVSGIATAPQGLYAIHGATIHELDPDTRTLGSHIANIGLYGHGIASQLDAASDGRLYFLFEPQTVPACPPPCGKILVTEPADEADHIEDAPALLWAATPFVSAFAIDRRCYESENVRCLQRGRFRTEVSYEAYDGASGDAKTTPSDSPDTAIFYFFGPENWELMVKVLDGCGLNSKFWVYSSASTDVEYTMTITDTQTLAQKVYTNPLGRIAETVTDNLAFPCTP